MKRELSRRGVNDMSVSSAGLIAIPDDVPEQATIDAARRAGVDVASHRARRFEPSLLADNGWVLVMEAEQREAVLSAPGSDEQRIELLSRFSSEPGDIGDPEGQGAKDFDRCVARIKDGVEGYLSWFLEASQDG